MLFSTPITITDYTNKTWSLNSSEAFESFIKHEADFWRMQSSSQFPSANQFIQCHNNFQQLINQLISWQPNFTNWDNATSQGHISSLIIQQLNTNWLWSGHAFIEKWIE